MNREWEISSRFGHAAETCFTGATGGSGKFREGRLDTMTFAGGLSVHLCNLVEQKAGPTRLELPQGLTLVLLLRGGLDFKLKGRNAEVTGAQREGCCSAVMLDSRASLQWEARACPLRMVQVCITPEWLGTHCPEMIKDVRALTQPPPVKLPVWQASPQSRATARAMLALAEQPASLQRLEMEIRALLLASEGLAALGRLANREGPGSRRAQKVAAVQEYLDTHLTNPLNLAALGSQFGMSVSTLQRYFKQITGLTVGDYLRQRRLQLAREQLLKAGATISEAAFTAGYGHTSNFITAYKRHFGHCPGKARASPPPGQHTLYGSPGRSQSQPDPA